MEDQEAPATEEVKPTEEAPAPETVTQEAKPERPAPTQADLDKAYDKARKFEAENKKLREEQEAREMAEKTELERANAQIEKMENEREKALGALRRAKLITALNDPSAGVAPDAIQIVADVLEVEYDEDHSPVDLPERLAAFLESHPSLKAPTASSNGSPANVAANRHSGGNALTPEDVRRLAKEDPVRFNELWDKGEIPESSLST